MNKLKSNINSLIGTAFVVGLFMLIVCLCGNADGTNHHSFSHRTPIQVVHVMEVDHSALHVSTNQSTDFYPSFVACKVPFPIHAFNKTTRTIISSNHKVNLLLKNSKNQFIVIKPMVIDFVSFHVRTSLDNEDIPSIS